jgi:hypothetical protein
MPIWFSCWTDAGAMFAVAALATGVIIAKLRAANAARTRYFIGIPISGRARCPAWVRG